MAFSPETYALLAGQSGGGGGSGGDNLFIVNFTIAGSDPAVATPDKTFDEIASALNSGKVIVGRTPHNGVIYQQVFAVDDAGVEAILQNLDIDVDGFATVRTIKTEFNFETEEPYWEYNSAEYQLQSNP